MGQSRNGRSVRPSSTGTLRRRSTGREEGMLREPFSGQRAIHSVSTDSDIIRRSRDRPLVFGELYDRHASAIYRYAARRAGDFAADDVISETFLVAWEQPQPTTSAGMTPARGCSASPPIFSAGTTALRPRCSSVAAKAASREALADDSDRSLPKWTPRGDRADRRQAENHGRYRSGNAVALRLGRPDL